MIGAVVSLTIFIIVFIGLREQLIPLAIIHAGYMIAWAIYEGLTLKAKA